ncbi:MAG: polyamine ABC transporter substrate-binding protein [Deltaproteobacteria bacterium]|nr:polyamine ABC transporter substrate-binding protein [Deltaproteobacteria bacterium]
MKSLFGGKILFSIFVILLAMPLASIALAEKGVLVAGYDAGDALGWDPFRVSPTPDKFVDSLIYSGLVRFKPGDINPANVEPDLAESWEVSEDGLTWTFHLRKGVQWHKGYGEFTAYDAEWSLRMTRDKSWARKQYAAFKEIKALDKYTLQIKLANRIPSVLGILTDYHGGWIANKKAYEKLGKDYPLHPVGTKSFVVKEYIPNQRTVLVAHEEYFRGKPKIKKIILRYMPDLSSREMAFRKGDLNMIEGVREQQWVEKMKALPDTVVDVFGPGETVTLHFNITKKPFDDIRVRKAVCYAINREALVKFMGKDVAVPLYSVIPMDYLGGTEAVERYDYNPQKAKQLLKEAGYPNGFEFEDVITEMAVYKRPLVVIQAQLRKVGIKMKLRVVIHPSFHSLIRKDTNHIVEYICARFPVADQMLSQFFHSSSIVMTKTAITNFSHYTKIDDLLDKARVEMDTKKQVALWKKAQQMILEDAVAYPLFVSKFVFARKPWVDYGYDLKSSLSLSPQFYENSEVTK